MAMDDDAKLQCVIRHLTESHLEVDGGYPYDWCEVALDFIVIAALDARKELAATKVEVYAKPILIALYDIAVSLIR
jgi:hypothetical protein